jgi:hypothetical protein
MLDDRILDLVTKVNKMYKILYGNVMVSPFIKKTVGDSTGNSFDTMGFFDLIRNQRITYLDVNNELLSNSETVVRRMIDECHNINDVIVDALDIENKLGSFPFDLSKLFSEGKYELIIKLYVENFKYLESHFEEIKKSNISQSQEEVDKILSNQQ